MIRIGCSGWNSASWRASFYPTGLSAPHWLEHYASVFDTVEVNTTFYRLARREAVQRWARQTPEDFCFAVKSSRYLTHIKRLTDLNRGVQRLYEPLEPLAEAGKFGPMLRGCGARGERAGPVSAPSAASAASAAPRGG